MPAPSIMREKPGVVRGAPRSDTNTKDDRALSRRCRRSSRSSRPVNGCVAGVPSGPADVQGRVFKINLFPRPLVGAAHKEHPRKICHAIRQREYARLCGALFTCC